jgi:hypothetical protein
VAQPAGVRVEVRVLPSVRKPQIVRRSSSFVKTRVGRTASVRSERELLLRELDRRAAQAHHARRRVDLELADAQAPGAPAHVGAAQQRLDAARAAPGS